MNNEFWKTLDFIRGDIPLCLKSIVSIMLSIKSAKLESGGDDAKAITLIQKNNLGLTYRISDETVFSKLYYCFENVEIFECLRYVLEMNFKRESGVLTPPVIKNWFDEKINNTEGKAILIPEFEHYLYDIGYIATKNPNKIITIGTAIDELKKLLEIEYRNYSNIKVVKMNIYDDIQETGKYDLIVSNPVFGGRKMVDEGKNICRELDLVALENLLSLLSIDGALHTVHPARISFGGTNIAKLRKYVERNYGIAEIRELPAGIFSYSGVKTIYFEFTAKQNDKILISAYDSTVDKKTKSMNISCAAEQYISKEELYSQENWQINHLLSPTSDLLQTFYNSPVNKVKIKDVAEIFRGKAVNNKGSGGNISVINISNISEAGIDYNNLETFEEEERKVKRYELQEGDVLLTCRGTTIKTATFEQQNNICIPAVNLVVIRPKSELNSKFLEIFFQTPIGKAIFDGFSSGETSIMIKHTDVMEIIIPLPPLEKQNEIVEYYEHEKSIYLESIKVAQERWKQTQSEFLNTLM